jgi:uncharacterized protein (DUF427 family)
MSTMLAHMHPTERIEPGPGQESVWDYPRPPRLEPVAARLRVVVADEIIADTTAGHRVLETSQPPTYYVPPADIDFSFVRPTLRRTFCEWKGQAQYWTITVDHDVRPDAAWSYARPTAPFAAITDHLAFYPQRVDACSVDDEPVVANEGSFYGGWITANIVGPFKGGPGTVGW